MALGFFKKVFSFGEDERRATPSSRRLRRSAPVPPETAAGSAAGDAARRRTPPAPTPDPPLRHRRKFRRRRDPSGRRKCRRRRLSRRRLRPRPAERSAAVERQPRCRPRNRRSAADRADDAAPSLPKSTPPQPAASPSSGREMPQPTSPVAATKRGRAAAPGKVTVTKTVEQKAEPPPRRRQRRNAPGSSGCAQGLSRSSRELTGNIAGVFTKRKLDEETLQDLEDVLIRADLGMETALRVTDALAPSRYGKDVSDAEVRAVMAGEIEKVLAPVAQAAGARPVAQAACHPRRRRQRHRQDHHHRQARGQAHARAG